MLNNETLISRIDSELTRPVPRDASTATLNLLNGWLVRARTNLEALRIKEQAIKGNSALSDAGKTAALAKLYEDALPEWKWFSAVLHDREAARARFETLLFTIEPTVKDDLLRYHRAREIRDGIAGLNQNEKDVAYLRASEQLQLEVMLAMRDAPGGSWVTPEIQRRADIERAKRQQPDAFAAYEQNEILHERVAGLADHLAQTLKAYGVPSATVTTTLGLAA